MYQNQYDTDVTMFSPQGRLHQLEYAMEAVKQGSPCVGLRSATHAVLVVYKRSPDELASHLEKLFKVDEHMAIAISGLTADARYLCKHMRTECLNYKFVYGGTLQVGRLVNQVADMHQRCTQDLSYERKRPFGVGLLVIGHDKTGPHLYETSPSANYYEFKAQAIGARSQSAKTYLERHFESFNDLSVDELIRHGVRAVDAAAGDSDLNTNNTGIAIVGKDQPLKMLSAEEIQAYLESSGVLAGGGAEAASSKQQDDAPADAADVEMTEA